MTGPFTPNRGLNMDRVEWLVRAVRWSIITRRQALAKKYLTPAERALLRQRLKEIGE